MREWKKNRRNWKKYELLCQSHKAIRQRNFSLDVLCRGKRDLQAICSLRTNCVWIWLKPMNVVLCMRLQKLKQTEWQTNIRLGWERKSSVCLYLFWLVRVVRSYTGWRGDLHRIWHTIFPQTLVAPSIAKRCNAYLMLRSAFILREESRLLVYRLYFAFAWRKQYSLIHEKSDA